MNKFKLFVENFLVYGLGGVISKIIPLLMIPIVTRLMPSSDYYGLADLSNTVVSFASALAVMGMYDAMYRMFFEKDDEEFKKSTCSTALLFTLSTSVIIFLLMILFRRQHSISLVIANMPILYIFLQLPLLLVQQIVLFLLQQECRIKGKCS